MVSASPRVVVSTSRISSDSKSATVRLDLQQQRHRLIGELLGAEDPASEVTAIRNGNSAINADSAMWLAIAQPSSARNV